MLLRKKERQILEESKAIKRLKNLTGLILYGEHIFKY